MPWPLHYRITINVLINIILFCYICIDIVTIFCNFITNCAEYIEKCHHQTTSQSRHRRHLRQQIKFLQNRNLNLHNETMNLRRQQRQFLNMINEQDNLQLSNQECPHHHHRPQAQSMFYTSAPQKPAQMERNPQRLPSPPPSRHPMTSQTQIQDSDDSSNEDSSPESNPHIDRPPMDRNPSQMSQDLITQEKITSMIKEECADLVPREYKPSRMSTNVPRDLKAPPLKGQPVSTTGPFETDSCRFHGRHCPLRTPVQLRRAQTQAREDLTQIPSTDSNLGRHIIQKVAEVIMVRDLDSRQEHSPMDPDGFNGPHRENTHRERSCPPSYNQATMTPKKPCPPSPPQRAQSLPPQRKELTETAGEASSITLPRPPTPFPHGEIPTTPLLRRLEPQTANLEPLLPQNPSSENSSRMMNQLQNDKENRPPQDLTPGQIRLTIQQGQGQEFEVQLMEFPDEPQTEDSNIQTSHTPI